jgi:hypothetical protein
MLPRIHDIKREKYGLAAGVEFSLFSKDIQLVIEEGTDKDYAQQCADYLNSLPDGLIDDLCRASARYCDDHLDRIGEPRKVFASPRDILKNIYPSGQRPVIHMELNCDWEEEHGMEWVVHDDKVLYVGPFVGEDPMRDISRNDPGNFCLAQ